MDVMSENIPAMRTALSRVRGLGSAKHGTEHWWLLRLTSLALIPLSLYLVGAFVIYVVFGGYPGARYWLHAPLAATAMILFLAVGFHHTASGLQVVIEDYLHIDGVKLGAVIAVKIVCTAFGVLGILAVLKIVFGAP
jgi:succinate dehydrogenase / fumarate reductase membrane anchor subunit